MVEEFTLGPQPSKPIVRFDYDMVVEGTPNRMEIYDTVHFSLNAMLPRSAFQTEVVIEHGSQGEGLSDLYNEVEEEGSDTQAEEDTENEADNGEEASTEGGDGSARRLRGEMDVQIRRSLAMESSFFVSYSVVCLDDESARDIMTLMSERHYQVEKIVTDFLRDVSAASSPLLSASSSLLSHSLLFSFSARTSLSRFSSSRPWTSQLELLSTQRRLPVRLHLPPHFQEADSVTLAATTRTRETLLAGAEAATIAGVRPPSLLPSRVLVLR